jgi:hypothetical protein
VNMTLFPPKDLGVISTGSKHEVSWDLPEGINFEYVYSGCSCADPELEDGKVTTVFHAGQLPLQHANRGWYARETYVTLVDDNEVHYKLAIRSEIHKR